MQIFAWSVKTNSFFQLKEQIDMWKFFEAAVT